MEKVKSEKIFKDAKFKVEKSVRWYNHLCNTFPRHSFPILASRIWREGMLAEIWGTVATKLSKEGVNYLDEWRQGR